MNIFLDNNTVSCVQFHTKRRLIKSYIYFTTKAANLATADELINCTNNRDALLKCLCRESLLFKDGNDIILKCRIIKISKGVAWAKCKRCGQWVIIPLKLTYS